MFFPYMDLIEIEGFLINGFVLLCMFKYKLANIEKSIQDGAIALKNRINLNLLMLRRLRLMIIMLMRKIHLMADAINVPISRISDSSSFFV